MTKKTIKDLDGELTLVKKELKDMRGMFDALAEKYAKLEKSYELLLPKCNVCDEVFPTKRNLMRHNNIQHKKHEQFVCNECEKTFSEEWKLNAHKKMHKKYPCDQCDKSFSFQSLKEKHIKIQHENVKLFCHFHNNNKDCPNEEECVFLHESSGMCRYMDKCEREYCMYQHENAGDEEESDKEEKSDNDDDTTDDEDKLDDDDTGKTFCNPSQSDGSEEEEGTKFKCDMCTFETEDKTRFSRHTFESHSVKGKYACMICKREFDTRKDFNNHKYFAH